MAKPAHDKLGITAAIPLLRLDHVLAFSDFLNDIGAPFEKTLERNQLPVACENLNRYVPLARAWAFFDDIARTEDPIAGWTVGRMAGDRHMNGDLIRRFEASPSVYQALHKFLAMKKAEATTSDMGIVERTNDILLFTRYQGKSNDIGYHQSQAYQIGVLIGLMRHFLGASWIPHQIGIEHQSILPGVQEMFPDSQILTGQFAGFIVIPRCFLHLSACNKNPNIKSNESNVPPDETNVATVVTELVRTYMPDGYPSAAKTAKILGFSERSLARKLSTSGITYGDIVDEERFKIAKDLLKQPDIKKREIAMALGFDDPSNFGRMFRRLAGISPKQYSNLFR